MKNYLFQKSNKGIAMITIMITITFLAIISTTLLYISATNYAMKAANAQGKNSFYSTDAQLVQLTVAVRQKIMNSGSEPQTVISDLGGSVANTYSITKMVQEVYPSATGTDTYCTVIPDSSKPEDKYIFKAPSNTITEANHPSVSNTKRYTFSDIEIVHVNTATGYKNSVKSDLVLDVFKAEVPAGGGGGGVGSMSMLLDSPLSSTYSNFKNLTMAGNAFVADYSGGATDSFAPDPGHTYIKPGTNGLTMNNESRLNLYGDYNVIYGDLNLSNRSTLAVYGNLTVFGNINITGQASLIMGEGSRLFQYVDGPLPGRGSACTCNIDAQHVYPASTTVTAIPAEKYTEFCDLLNLRDSGTKYGLINKIFKENPKNKNNVTPSGLTNKNLMDLSPSNGDITCYSVTGLDNTPFDLGRGYKTSGSPIYGLHDFGIGFIGVADTSSMNAADYNYRLMLTFNNNPIVLQQSTPYSTWISKSAVTCKQAHCVVLSKLGTAQFNYMTAGKGDLESKCYDNDLNPFNKIHIKLGSVDFEGKFGAFFNSDCNTSIDTMFGIAGGSGSGGSTPIYASSAIFDNYDRDFE